MLYRISAGLLLLATLGHTFGGMLGTARRGPRAGAEADRVFAEMKSVYFTWQGADTTWFRFWLGNGLCVSAAFLVPIVVLWVLGALDPTQAHAMLPIRWAVFISLALTSFLVFDHFAHSEEIGFCLVAVLSVSGLFVA